VLPHRERDGLDIPFDHEVRAAAEDFVTDDGEESSVDDGRGVLTDAVATT
jgi:hypothetical protein